MHVRVALLPALAAVVALTATGCGGSGGGSGSGGAGATAAFGARGAIGISMPSTTMTRWISDGENIKRQLTVLGYGTDLQFAQDDAGKQVQQLEAMIARHDRALVIGSVDGGALKDVLRKAADAKIPVIAYDRLIRDTPNVDYYATFDNFKVGVVQAQAIVTALGLDRAKRPRRIELFAGSPDDNNAVFFFKGSMSVLQPYLASGALVVPSRQTDFAAIATQGWDGKIARARMARLLAGPDARVPLDAVLSPNDGIARGVLGALQDAGYGGGSRPLPVITGQDAELDSVKLISSGQQAETVYKDTRELAKVAVQMVDAVLTGETPAVNDTEQYDNGVKRVPTFLLQPVGVDKANLRRVLVDGGYYTAAQVGA